MTSTRRARPPSPAYRIGWGVVEGWYLEHDDGARVARYPLDRDRRHARFFLSERDQRRVGVRGLVALEGLARRVLGPQR